MAANMEVSRSVYKNRILDISPIGGYALIMYHPKNSKERIEHRYKISLGHLKKVIEMVEKDAYCIDVILQSQAVQKALKATDEVLLENHLKTCAAGMIRKGQSDKAIKEIIQVIKKGGK